MSSHSVRERLRHALADATQRLGAAGVPSPSTDARALLQAAAGTERPLVLLDALPEDFTVRCEELLARRAAREPLQLVLGSAPFRRLQLEIRPGVFIPRPETEVALDLLSQHCEGECRSVVDLCAGSGALGAAVLDELPEAQVLAVEIDPGAADLAQRNLEAAGPGRGQVLTADIAAPPTQLLAAAPVDAVLANPPYIPAAAVPRDPEVLAHDPHRALFGGGEDGLEVPGAVIDLAARLLRPGGLLIMEHADVQGAATRELATAHGGFTAVRTAQDLTGRDRFLLARRAEIESTSEDERLNL